MGIKKRLVQFVNCTKEYLGKNSVKKCKDEKHTYYLKIINEYVCLVKRKKTYNLQPNKVLNTRDRANIMKIIRTWPRASLPRFHLNGSLGSHWWIGLGLNRVYRLKKTSPIQKLALKTLYRRKQHFFFLHWPNLTVLLCSNQLVFPMSANIIYFRPLVR